MRRLGSALLALAVMASVTTAPARAAACGKPAVASGCCCKHKPAPPKPCCQVSPATSDAAVLSGVTGVAPDLAPVALALEAPLPVLAGIHRAETAFPPSPPGSPPVFLLDCTFRI